LPLWTALAVLDPVVVRRESLFHGPRAAVDIVVPPKSWRGYLCRFGLGVAFPDAVSALVIVERIAPVDNDVLRLDNTRKAIAGHGRRHRSQRHHLHRWPGLSDGEQR
jgi:hypothetical protein